MDAYVAELEVFAGAAPYSAILRTSVKLHLILLENAGCWQHDGQLVEWVRAERRYTMRS